MSFRGLFFGLANSCKVDQKTLVEFQLEYTPYHAAAILDLKQGWTGIKIAKMSNDHCYVHLQARTILRIYTSTLFNNNNNNN